eukprot:TRINITY_DN5875_c0_g2_i9.p1 TRINITY_DN5875_c0_g2~~TRINITY_DN5875_c0_g2_i9.p1  ORF type:complete len:292 (+),score=51.51 TRINITY_DN5875_c0_g2_i9:817-1692(+)
MSFGTCAFLSRGHLPTKQNTGSTFDVNLKFCNVDNTTHCADVLVLVNTGAGDSHLSTAMFLKLGILVDRYSARVQTGFDGRRSVAPAGDVLVELGKQLVRMPITLSGQQGANVLGLRALVHFGGNLVLSGPMQGLHFSDSKFTSFPAYVNTPVTIDAWAAAAPFVYPDINMQQLTIGAKNSIDSGIFALHTRILHQCSLSDKDPEYVFCALAGKLLHCSLHDELCVRGIAFEFATLMTADNNEDGITAKLDAPSPEYTMITDERRSLVETARMKCTDGFGVFVTMWSVTLF